MSVPPPAFRPPPLMGNAHVQTLASVWRWPWSAESRAVAALERRSETRVVPVDEHTRVTVRETVHVGLDRPWLLLVHGLAGCCNSAYMRGTAVKAFAAGLHVARMNVRNCGGTEALTPTLYHAGLTADVAAVARHLGQERGRGPVHVAGFSLGGNMVLRWAGELGEEAPAWLASVAAVSPALHLPSCAALIDKSRSARPYRSHLLGLLKAAVVTKARLYREQGAAWADLEPGLAHVLRGIEHVRDLSHVRTMHAMDDRFVARPFGFDGADDYYERASALPWVPRIARPALVIHARDDVLVPPDGVDLPAVREAPAVTLLLTDRGGHCAFLGARAEAGGGGRFWAENRVVAFALRHGR